jgi:hypothetical protein
MRSVQASAVRIEVLIEVLRLVWRVDEDIGLRHSRTRVVVRAEGGPVVLCGPVRRQRETIVTKLEERCDNLFLRRDEGLMEGLLQLWVFRCSVPHIAKGGVHRLFTW